MEKKPYLFKQYTDKIFAINSDTPQKAGRIFLGVKGGKASSIDAKRSSESRINKYEVRIRRRVEQVQISAIVTWLRNWILDAFYGPLIPDFEPYTYDRVMSLMNVVNPNTSFADILENWGPLTQAELKDELDNWIVQANKNVRVVLQNAETRNLRLRIVGKDVPDDVRSQLKSLSFNSQYGTDGDPLKSHYTDIDMKSGQMFYLTSANKYYVYDPPTSLPVGGSAALTKGKLVCELDILDFGRTPGRIVIYGDGNCRNDYTVKAYNPHKINSSTYDTEVMSKNIYHAMRSDNGSSLRGRRDGGIIPRMFNSFLNANTVKAIQALLVIYVAISSILYISGLVKTPQFDFVVRMIKIGFVSQLCTPDAWAFFNNYLFSFVYQGMQELIGMVAGGGSAKSGEFRFLDDILGVLLSTETWIKVASFMFVIPMGGLVLYIVGVSFWELFCGTILGLCMYFLSVIAVAFLISVSPIFLSAILFQRTKGLFDGMMKALVNYGLQPVFLFAFISILAEITMTFVHQILDFSVCHRCVWEIPLAFMKICMFGTIMPFGRSRAEDMSGIEGDGADIGFTGIPFSVFPLLMIYLLGTSIKIFVDISQRLTQSLTNSMGGVQGSAPSEGSQGSGAAKMYDTMKEPFGKDARTKAAREKAKGAAKRGNKSILEFAPKFKKDKNKDEDKDNTTKDPSTEGGKGQEATHANYAADGGDKMIRENQIRDDMREKYEKVKDVNDPQEAREAMKDQLQSAKDAEKYGVSDDMRAEIDKRTDSIQDKIDQLEQQDGVDSSTNYAADPYDNASSGAQGGNYEQSQDDDSRSPSGKLEQSPETDVEYSDHTSPYDGVADNHGELTDEMRDSMPTPSYPAAEPVSPDSLEDNRPDDLSEAGDSTDSDNNSDSSDSKS